MGVQGALILLALVSCCSASTDKEFIEKILKASKRQARAPAQRGVFDDYTPGLPGGFKCAVLAPSATKPTDARFVRPSDVQVVAALGDSITAANGVLAWTVPGVLQQYRGLSWSAGGDKDITKVLTMPNILRKYNSKLYGYSLGSSYFEDITDAYYNVASAGDTAIELVDQSVNLVKKVKANNRQNDWKVITIFIGGNDVCEYCNFPDTLSPDNYKKNVITVIDNLYNAFTNTIVNLVGPIDLTQVTLLPDGFGCKAVHQGVCGCAYDKNDPGYATRMSRAYQEKAKELMSEVPTRWPRKDFAVSYHPQYDSLQVPMLDGEPDLSYMAPDCFHFSQKGQEHAAITLWNNMMTPAGSRATTMQLGDRSMICPTEAAPYILI